MKVLNLYAGIGGNRKLWEDVEVTAVEYDPKIAAIYQDFFPNDTVIIADAHQYLLDHFKEFEFIWSSPPCPTHSRMNNLSNIQEGKSVKYPDMKLYEEIIYLRHWFAGKFCVENVISYYEPLIRPIESNSHYFWTNFNIPKFPNEKRGIRGEDREYRKNKINFDVDKFDIPQYLKTKVIANCVEPEIALAILDCARGIIRANNSQQQVLDL